MVDWLNQELLESGETKLHLVQGEPPPDVQKAIEGYGFDFPRSYTDFIRKYGNASLYRWGQEYQIKIFLEPGAIRVGDQETYYRVASEWGVPIVVDEQSLDAGKEAPVLAFRDGVVEPVAPSFGRWLQQARDRARGRYSEQEWESFFAPIPPFSEDEQRIIDRRNHFKWRHIGIDDDGSFVFEITNESNGFLPFLTVAIRERHGRFTGGVWLPVATVGPGMTALVKKQLYDELADPLDLQAFHVPPPTPLERDLYWEFRPMTSLISQTSEDGTVMRVESGRGAVV